MVDNRTAVQSSLLRVFASLTLLLVLTFSESGALNSLLLETVGLKNRKVRWGKGNWERDIEKKDRKLRSKFNTSVLLLFLHLEEYCAAMLPTFSLKILIFFYLLLYNKK